MFFDKGESVKRQATTRLSTMEIFFDEVFSPSQRFRCVCPLVIGEHGLGKLSYHRCDAVVGFVVVVVCDVDALFLHHSDVPVVLSTLPHEGDAS